MCILSLVLFLQRRKFCSFPLWSDVLYKHCADILLLKESDMSVLLGLMEDCLPKGNALMKSTKCITIVHRQRCNKGKKSGMNQVSK